MIPCKNCNALNGLDAVFCKRCGAGLPEADIQAGKDKLEALVKEGMRALNEGRINEAMAVAETAVVADPTMTSAFALKSAAHERIGQIAAALECAEKIVELNPDSELDKIKRNQLRTALGAQALALAPPNRLVPFVISTAVMLILGCVVALAAHLMDRPQPEVRLVPNQGGANAVVQQNLPTVTAQPTPGTSDPAPQSNVNQPDQKPISKTTESAQKQAEPNVQRDQRVGDEVSSSAKSSGTGLPPSSGDSVEVTPLSPPAPATSSTPVSTHAPSAKEPSGGDPAPKPEVEKNQAVPVKPVDQGQIVITVHHDAGGTAKSTGSDDVRDTSKMYSRMGNEYFLTGRYGEAAQRFEKALTSGADPIYVNERLAQSYSSLGRKQEAANAYRRAIDACSTALGAGKGDNQRVRAVRDACETALQQLQGG